MILPKYKPNFEALDQGEAMYLANAMRLPEIHALDGSAIYEIADEAGMDQADVVMTLAHDPNLQGVQVVEKLIGKPITRKPRPVPTTRVTRAPRPVTTAVAPYDRNSRISFVAENPKKQGSASYGRFSLYKVGMTVGDFLAAGGTMGDVKWDSERGFIKFEDQGDEK